MTTQFCATMSIIKNLCEQLIVLLRKERGSQMSTLQIANIVALLLVAGYAFYLFGYVVYQRYQYIRLGKPVEFELNFGERFREILINVFGQKKLLKDMKSGIMHVIMFYGFIIIQFGAIDLFWKGLQKGGHLPLGPLYGPFLFLQEITTFLVLAATLYAFYRRYIEKLARLKRNFKSGLVIIFLTTLMFSILMAAGFEKIWLGHGSDVYTPISSSIASLFGGLSSEIAGGIFYVFWWLHALVLFTFLVYVPQSKHFHLLMGPVNVFLKRQQPPAKLSMIDFEDESVEEYGVGKITDFTQKQLIDLYACVECGRCTSMCPASGTGKMLSPMQLIVKLRDHLTEQGAAITSKAPWVPTFAFASANQAALEAATGSEGPSLIGDVITEQEIWACTTCRNCEDQCPVMNEHVDKIVDMRRYLVMTQGKMNGEASRTFSNIERQGNPWGISKKDRNKWTEDSEVPVPTVKEEKEFEYLFFVGSMGAYDNRSQKISRALVKLLTQAGVKFAVLGNKEKNSGDTPRRMGNEFLFQQLAADNIAQFEKNDVKKIITIDPHAFNTFKNEYPDLGFKAEVHHHSEVLADLVKDGRLKPTKEVKERITYHDSCYLGRYNGVYSAPRYILSQIPGIELVEMKRSHENAMCCGAGGGMMWMEEHEGTRVNVARTEQALEVNPTMIGSACPYCLTMLSDGTKAKEVEDHVQTMDIAEILALSVEFDLDQE